MVGDGDDEEEDNPEEREDVEPALDESESDLLLSVADFGGIPMETVRGEPQDRRRSGGR